MITLFSRRGFAGLIATCALAGITTLAGCGGSSSDDSSSPTETPTIAERDSATRGTHDGTRITASALESVNYLSDAEETRQAATTAAVKPVITRSGTTTTVTLDYGTTGTVTYGGRTITGVITITASSATKTGTVTFSNVTIDTHSITGSVSLSNIAVTSTTAAATCTFNLAVGGVGSTVGTATLSTVRSSHVTTMSSGNFTVTPVNSTTTYTVIASNLVTDPVTNGNFVPQSGTMTVTYPLRNKTVSAVVTYSASSPSTGVVTVSVNGGAATAYTLPRY